MTELQLQLADTARHLDTLRSAAASGDAVSLSDIVLFQRNAEWLACMLKREFVARLAAVPERTAEEDRAAQRVVA
jgi:hypothetical protein